MVGAFIAAGSALAMAILLTPTLIRSFTRSAFAREQRVERLGSDHARPVTPTMGGVAIVAAVWFGYLLAHLLTHRPFTAVALLVLCLSTVLAAVGLLDDLLKLRRRSRSGVASISKAVGQVLTAMVFGVLALRFSNAQGLAPASGQLSFVRDFAPLPFGVVGFVVLFVLVVYTWSSAVNITDGLDGLAAGASGLVVGVYVIIALWQLRNQCVTTVATTCYEVPAPLDVAIVAAAALGGCIGFLWWNAAPARMQLGATGSLALGGLIAGLSVVTRTELLVLVIGGVFVVEFVSVAVQVAVFRVSHRRVFRMAPFHHHFELGGWAEATVIIRLWLLGGICAAVGLALFYNEWLGASATG